MGMPEKQFQVFYAEEAVDYLIGQYRLTRDEAYDVVHSTRSVERVRDRHVFLRSDIDKTYERQYGLL